MIPFVPNGKPLRPPLRQSSPPVPPTHRERIERRADELRKRHERLISKRKTWRAKRNLS